MLFEDRSYQQIAYDDVGPYYVSTVWLGLDHSFGSGAEPLIFETMVFEQEASFKKPSEWFPEGYAYHRDYEQRRYASEQEALAGHAALVAEIRLLISAFAS